jgi:hypothetical protein
MLLFIYDAERTCHDVPPEMKQQRRVAAVVPTTAVAPNVKAVTLSIVPPADATVIAPVEAEPLRKIQTVRPEFADATGNVIVTAVAPLLTIIILSSCVTVVDAVTMRVVNERLSYINMMYFLRFVSQLFL